VQPRWAYGWNVVGLTLVAQGLSIGILIYSFALFVVPWIDTFGSERAAIMTAMVVMQLGTGLISPFSGRAMDRVPIRYLMIAGALATGLGLVLASLATALWQIIAIFATFMPLGMSLTGPLAAQTLVTKWFADRRGLAVGVSAMGTSIGGFMLPPLVSLLVAGYSWRVAFMVLAVFMVVVICPLAFWVLRREPPVVSEAVRSAQGHHGNWSTLGIMSTSVFWITLVVLVPVNAGFGGVQFNLGALVDDLGFGPGYAASLISVTALSMIFGKLFFGGVGDRVDHRLLFWVMVALMAGGLWQFAHSVGVGGLITGAVFMGLATGGVLPLSALVVGSRFGAENFGQVMGLVNAGMTLGAVGPLLAGWVFDQTGSYEPAFLAFLVALIPGAVLMAWLPSIDGFITRSRGLAAPPAD
jgi:MFS family permease